MCECKKKQDISLTNNLGEPGFKVECGRQWIERRCGLKSHEMTQSGFTIRGRVALAALTTDFKVRLMLAALSQ